MKLRIVKRTYGTKDITEACQEAFEPYFRDYTVEFILEENEKQQNRRVEDEKRD